MTMGRLPDFLIIGASRCGTSSLFVNLLQHPRIEGPSLPGRTRLYKEIGFFSKAKRYNRGIEWYKGRFPKIKKEILYSEASAGYFRESSATPHIFKYLPHANFIILLRNPVDRAVSYYSRWKRKQEQWNPQELKDSNYDLGIHKPTSKRLIIKEGIYVKSLYRWFRYFSRDQFLIIKSEDYFKNENKIIKQCFKWLGIDAIKIENPLFLDTKTIKEEWCPYEREIPNAVKKYLRKFYEPYNLKLYELLGRDFGWQ